MASRERRVLGILIILVFAVGFYSGIQFQENRSKPPSAAGSVVLLTDKEYMSNLLYLLDHADSYVHVIMFVVKYDAREENDPVNQVLHRLVDLADRGVDVRIIVDDATLRSYSDTIRFLKDHGINVKLDESSGRTTHTKMVIIDGEILLVGSHNWTESALSRNHEATILVRDSTIIGEAEEYFEAIYSGGRSV